MGIDLLVLHAINGLAGTVWLDQLGTLAMRFDLLNGGGLAAIWWFWYSGDPKRNRPIILEAILAMVAAFVICRALIVITPFRDRPMFTDGVGYLAPSTPVMLFPEKWTSFPSDAVAIWFALTFGIWRMSRVGGVLAAIYSIVWIGLPRLYFGLHWPSDLMVGATIGLTSGWAVKGLHFNFRTIFAFEQRLPKVFYALMFLISFEMATFFDSTRMIMRALGNRFELAFVVCVIAIAAIIVRMFRKRANQWS